MIRLPEVVEFKQDENHHRYAWSDHYGAFHVLQKYTKAEINVKKFSEYFIWHHGCVGPWRNRHPLLVSSVIFDKNLRQFVERKDQEQYLKAHGYRFVYAVGLPIIYEEMPSLKRLGKSLLIMPTHTLPGDGKLDQSYYDEYVEYIKMQIANFEYVAVCLHEGCIKNGFWIDEFSSIGIDIIEGAKTTDKNAYLRQLCLFSQFDTITTPDWGSHVAYALYCGAKVSISGPKVPRSRKDFERDGTWENRPELIDLLLSNDAIADKDRYLRKFFCDPIDAKPDIALGKFFVGFSNKKDPKELLQLINGTFMYTTRMLLIKLYACARLLLSK